MKQTLPPGAERGNSGWAREQMLTSRHISGSSDNMVAGWSYVRLLKAPELSFFLLGMWSVGMYLRCHVRYS
jgi:hypothetical protein